MKKQDFADWWFGSSKLERVTAEQLNEEEQYIVVVHGDKLNREQLLHWVEDNPRLIQDTLIRMIESPIENRASTQLDGEELVRTILDNAKNLLFDKKGTVTPEDFTATIQTVHGQLLDDDIPPQRKMALRKLSEGYRAKARNEDNS